MKKRMIFTISCFGLLCMTACSSNKDIAEDLVGTWNGIDDSQGTTVEITPDTMTINDDETGRYTYNKDTGMMIWTTTSGSTKNVEASIKKDKLTLIMEGPEIILKKAE